MQKSGVNSAFFLFKSPGNITNADRIQQRWRPSRAGRTITITRLSVRKKDQKKTQKHRHKAPGGCVYHGLAVLGGHKHQLCQCTCRVSTASASARQSVRKAKDQAGTHKWADCRGDEVTLRDAADVDAGPTITGAYLMAQARRLRQ